jgi:hypothetical protein
MPSVGSVLGKYCCILEAIASALVPAGFRATPVQADISFALKNPQRRPMSIFSHRLFDRFGMRRLLAAFFLWALASLAWERWDRKAPVPPSGGLFFPLTVLLSVPSFAQADPRWGAEPLGSTQNTLRAEGCAVTSAAMALAGYGMDLDPSRLNAFLTANGGYTERGWIYWEVAALYEPGRVRHAYEDLPSHRLMDWNLMKGNPVIVRVRPPGRGTHFVLVVGKRGFDYIAQDPGAGGRQMPLRELCSQVEALRFYEKL